MQYEKPEESRVTDEMRELWREIVCVVESVGPKEVMARLNEQKQECKGDE